MVCGVGADVHSGLREPDADLSDEQLAAVTGGVGHEDVYTT